MWGSNIIIEIRYICKSSVCLNCLSPSAKGIYPKRKEFAPYGSKFFPFSVDPFQKGPVVFLQAAPRPFLCCSSFLFERRWFYMWRLFCPYLFPISPSFGASGGHRSDQHAHPYSLIKSKSSMSTLDNQGSKVFSR